MGPHHLQQLDLYHEGLLDARMRSVHPYGWGVVSQEIDTEALAAGQLQLLRFFGVLPDGLLLSFERGQPEAPAARPVEEHFKPSQRVLDVFLGVPKERDGAESYAAGNKVAPVARFVELQRPVADLADPSSLLPVAFARRNVKVLFGDESREDFECIKLAEVTRDKAGVLKLVDTYIPPCLRVDSSPFIMSGVRLLMRLLVAKQRELAQTRRHRDRSSPELTASDVTRFFQLNTLNSIIPVVNHVLDAGDLAPLELYLRLIQCAGQLHSFSPDGDPSKLPKFQFINLRATFEELFARFVELLRTVALEQCLSIPLEARGDGVYLAKLEDERLARCTSFLLAVRSDLSERLVADQLPKLAKVATWDELQNLVRSATPGIPVQATHRPPPEVPMRSGVVYFSLETLGTRWKNVVRERSLAVYLPSPFAPAETKLELLAVPPSEQR